MASSVIQPDPQLKRSNSKSTKSSQRIPLVHNLPSSISREGKREDSEEEKWLHSSSYDRTTGIPSRQRYSQLWLQTSRETVERFQSIQDVHNLRNDSPQPSSPMLLSQGNSSSLEERIKARKKEKHDNIIQSMYQSLSTHGSELRETVEQLCITFKTELGDIERNHSKLWNDKTNSEVILELSYSDISQLWKDSTCYCIKELEIIKLFESNLIEREEKHLMKVSKVLSDSLQSLNEVAYLFPHENEDILDRETLNINLSLLSNRKTYSHLCKSLEKCNQERTQESRCNCETLSIEWKSVKLKFIENKFCEFIESISHSLILTQSKDTFIKEQETLKQHIITHINTLEHFSPVQGSKVKIYQWKEEFEKLYETLISIQKKFLLHWSDVHRDIHHSIQEELEKIQEVLVNGHVLEHSEAIEFIRRSLHSLVSDHQRQVEEETRRIEKSLTSLTTVLLSQFTALFQYAQGAAHLWDTHVLKLDEVSRDHQTQLNVRRKEHDHNNQTMEANLDYILDRLRQAGSIEEANEYYKQSLQMLEKIRANYQLFHESMLSTSNRLPQVVKRELNDYDRELCCYLNVSRSPPNTEKTDKRMSLHSIKKSRRPSVSRQSDTTQATPSPVEELLHLIATSEGTSFYILSTPPPPSHGGKEKRKGSDNGTTFLTQDEDAESNMDTFVTSSLTIEQSLFTDIKEKYRLCFLNHLEKWRKSELLEAEKEIQDKEGEFITELELRMHLHQPRPQRVREDIHQIRTIELEAHEERIGAHVRGVTSQLHSQKDVVNELSALTDEKIAKFVTLLSELQSSLSLCNNTSSLTRLTTKATLVYTKSLEACHEMIFQIEESITNKLEEATTANGNYIASLKLFSEGGNYSNNEIERYRPRLLKQSDRINKYKEQLFDELQSIKDNIAQKFEQSYKKHFKNEMDHYVMDLSMLDNLNGTLTNCQVQIKTEVAFSNGQCKNIVDQMDTIRGRMNDIKFSLALSSLSSLFHSCHSRVKYLHCQIIKKKKRKDSTPTTMLSQAPPISAIEVTKSILSLTTSGHGSEEGTTKIKAISDITKQHQPQRKSSILVPLRRKNSALQDRKCINFGTEGGEDETECFLPKIRVILTSTYKKLYAMTEDYYRVKGSRLITQSDQLPETFKQCIDDLIGRCHGYYGQAESYRIKCIDELSIQLGDIGKLMEKLPVAILGGVAKECRDKCDEKLSEISLHFDGKTSSLEQRKVSNNNSLRPSLGHPDCINELNKLCEEENERHIEMETIVKEQTNQTKIALQEISKKFLLSVQETVTELLTVYDTSVDQEDILPHTVETPTEYQLMKEYVHGGKVNKQDASEKEKTSHSNYPSPTLSSSSSSKSCYVWSGLDDISLTFGDDTLAKTIKEKLKSHKLTTGHKAVIKTRDEITESYRLWYSACIDKQVQWERSQLEKEHKHYTAWEESVTAIKQLYIVNNNNNNSSSS